MGNQLLRLWERIPPDGRSLNLRLHYIMEIWKEKDAFIKKPWQRLSLCSQRAQLHNIMSLWLDSIAAMRMSKLYYMVIQQKDSRFCKKSMKDSIFSIFPTTLNTKSITSAEL